MKIQVGNNQSSIAGGEDLLLEPMKMPDCDTTTAGSSTSSTSSGNSGGIATSNDPSKHKDKLKVLAFHGMIMNCKIN